MRIVVENGLELAEQVLIEFEHGVVIGVLPEDGETTEREQTQKLSEVELAILHEQTAKRFINRVIILKRVGAVE
jgi:hypothetical protein